MIGSANVWAPVVGALGGVLVGGFVTSRLQREGWKREDRVRWHRDRRELYARFLKAADAYVVAGQEFGTVLAIEREREGAIAGEASGRSFDRLAEAFENLRQLEWEIEILAVRRREQRPHA